MVSGFEPHHFFNCPCHRTQCKQRDVGWVGQIEGERVGGEGGGEMVAVSSRIIFSIF